jgi:hypothetical protein
MLLGSQMGLVRNDRWQMRPRIKNDGLRRNSQSYQLSTLTVHNTQTHSETKMLFLIINRHLIS